MAYINGKEILFSAKVTKVGDIGLQEKSIDITQNGSYSVTPDTGKALSKASIKVNVQPSLQEKTVTANGDVVPDEGYDALSKVTVMVQDQKVKQLVGRTLTELTEEDLEGLTSIPSYAFYENTGLVSIVIPSTVTTIGSSAFWNATSLSSVEVPDGVTSIGAGCFNNCSIEAIKMPTKVTVIQPTTFQGCQKLKSIRIPDGVTSIGNMAFGGCISLLTVIIPSTVKTIGSMVFEACRSLEVIGFPPSVTNIDGWTMRGCEALKIVQVAASTPPTLGTNVFYGCTALEKIMVPTGCATAYKSATNWSTYADYIVEV